MCHTSLRAKDFFLTFQSSIAGWQLWSTAGPRFAIGVRSEQMKSEGNSWDGLDNAAELRPLREMFAQSPSFSALLQGFEHRFVQVNPAYQRLIGHRSVVGLTVREAIPEVEKQGFLALLDGVF